MPPVLALPRRRGLTRPPMEISEASVAARQSIQAIVTATRSPFGIPVRLGDTQIADLERSMRGLELKLAERERMIGETEKRLAERERELYELEALLLAREKLLAASRQHAPAAPISAEEKAALVQLRDELERQQTSLAEARQGIRDREQFLDESEAKLFEKVQSQQEKEIQLDQKADDTRSRERRLREAEARVDPAAAAALKAEDDAASVRDELNE
jgi:DNA repair exonuclease SbcCD ATPase subunit